MDTMSGILQRNILAVYTITPPEFRNKYEETINTFKNMTMDALTHIFTNLTNQVVSGQVPMNITAIPELMSKGDIDKVELMAEALAFSTLMYIMNMDFDRPFEWWKETTLQLIDLNQPPSTTIH